MAPNWNDYRFFLAVARTGRLSTAGRQLGVDHATVMRRIKTLEDNLKTILFDRAPSGYTLTSAGNQLVSIAERMEAEALTAQETIGFQLENFSGTVRIGIPDGIAAYIVVEAAQKVCDMYPHIEIQLVALPQKFSLSKREVDFVITVSPPEKGRLRIQKIADYRLHIYGTKSYLNKNPPIEKLEDLKKLRGIGYVRDLIFDKALDYVHLIDPTFHPHLTSTSIHVQYHAICNGAGVGILPDFMANHNKRLIKVLPIDISLTRTFWYVVQDDYAQLERVRVCAKFFIEKIRTSLRQYNAIE